MDYELTTVTGPALEPVGLTLAKLHLRVGHAGEDTLTAALIAAARQMTETHTGRRWINQALRLRLDRWPCDGVIRIPVQPVSAVSAVKYYDADGDEQTLAADQYQTRLGFSPPTVQPAPGLVWPVLEYDKGGAVSVEFTAGYGATEANVPPMVIPAMLLILGGWDENRGDQNALIARGIPPQAKSLLDLLWTGAH